MSGFSLTGVLRNLCPSKYKYILTWHLANPKYEIAVLSFFKEGDTTYRTVLPTIPVTLNYAIIYIIYTVYL